MMNTEDTIAAVATPIGSGGIGVIRISGTESFAVASRLFDGSLRAVADLPSHTAHHRILLDPASRQPVDDVVLTVFRSPRSYTGEDVVELSCHGGTATVKAVLNAVLQSGARLAEPGEFTRRAFLNGKLDLAQAEAVNDLIRARTDEARSMAARQLGGALSRKVREINDRLLALMARIEASVDFPDDVAEPDTAHLKSEIDSVRSDIDVLLESFGRGRVYREGIRLVIAGRVNVGKSSLLNALLRHARAIVTPVPGTTRDVIEEQLEIHGIPVVAIDTAGLRATDDPVEQIGVRFTEESLKSADVVVLVFDITQGAQSRDAELVDKAAGKRTIVVLNKVDLLSEHRRAAAAEDFARLLGGGFPLVCTSAQTGEGIEDLEDEVADLTAAADIGSQSVLVTNVRHQQALRSASQSLADAAATLSAGSPIDLLSVDLAAARSSLGLITGETAAEDLLDKIFSEFCIGK